MSKAQHQADYFRVMLDDFFHMCPRNGFGRN